MHTDVEFTSLQSSSIPIATVMNPLDEKRENLTSVQRAEQTEQMKENFQSSAKMLDNL